MRALWLSLSPYQKRLYGFAFVLLLATRLALMLALEARTSYTIDEPANLKAARFTVEEERIWRVKDSAMPVTLANAGLGNIVLHFFPKSSEKRAYRWAAMLINQAQIPLALELALLFGAGAWPAFLYTLFIAFEPSLLHHSLMVNVDGYLTTFFFALLIVAIRWNRARTLPHMAWFGLCLGALQGVKFSSAYLIPLCAFWVALSLRRSGWRTLARSSGVFFLSIWMGLCLVYAFNGLGTPLGDIDFRSNAFQALARHFPRLPALLPMDYLSGLDWVFSIERSERANWILGQPLTKGVWYYYLYALLVKTPLPLLVASMWGWWKVWRQPSRIKSDLWFLASLFLILFFYFSVIFNNQIGIRYILFFDSIFFLGVIWVRWTRAKVWVACGWLTLSLIHNWPNYLGYFNELLYSKTDRWWHLSDSNLSWRGDTADFAEFVRQHQLGDDQILPMTYPVGRDFYIEALTLTDLYPTAAHHAFLRYNFQPQGSYQGIWLRYIISPEDVWKRFPRGPAVTPADQNAPACTASGFEWVGHHQTVSLWPRYSTRAVEINHFRAEFFLKTRSWVLFQVGSAEGQAIFLNELPLPMVRKGYDALFTPLEPGRYVLDLFFNKGDRMTIVSWSGTIIDPNAGTARVLETCATP